MSSRTALPLISIVALALGRAGDVAAVDCDRAKAQREIEECAGTSLAKQNAELERAYSGYLRTLDG